ncbi:MAG: YncE family protein [Gemmatimonadales bacterium]|nr:MAG: YncE family protein [Gemmatimonadales bacterium]
MNGRFLRTVAYLVAGMIPAAGCASAGTVVASPGPGSGSNGAYLYVANQSSASVSVIDMETDEVVYTVDLLSLGFSPNAKPHHIVVEPDGSFWYVSLIADCFVLKFDRENNLVARAAFETPGLMALDAHSDRLYVGRSMAAVNPPQRIGVIQRSTMEIEEVDVFIVRPHAITVSPDGSHVYIASLVSNDMVAYMSDNGDIELVGVPSPDDHLHVLVQFAMTPDGRYLVASGEMTGKVLVLDASEQMAPAMVATIDVPAAPWHPVFSRDGSRMYIGNRVGNAVTVIDAANWKVVQTIRDERFAGPHGIALSPDGSKLYVGNRNTQPVADGEEPGNGFVAVIDTSSGEVIKLIEVGLYAAGMGTATPTS